jgi:hypothetical protein
MADIIACDGYASEAEIDGDQAIVRVRASAAVLRSLETSFPTVGPENVWTPTRKKPRNVKGEVALDGKPQVTRTLNDLAADVLTDAKWSGLKAQTESLMKRADREGYIRLDAMPHAEAARILTIVGGHGYGLDRISTGTFPTTGLLDQFNRAAIGANWTQDVDHGLEIVSSTLLKGVVVNSLNDAYWNPTTFGPDSEARITVVTKGLAAANEYSSLIARLDVGGNGYIVSVIPDSGTDLIGKGRLDEAVITNLGAFIDQEITNGDSFGIEMIGSTLTPYYKVGAGAWTAKASSSDSTYAGAGYLEIWSYSTTARLDDFGGGTVVVAPTNIVAPAVSGTAQVGQTLSCTTGAWE